MIAAIVGQYQPLVQQHGVDRRSNTPEWFSNTRRELDKRYAAGQNLFSNPKGKDKCNDKKTHTFLETFTLVMLELKTHWSLMS